jgi:hypothetical protein
MAVRAGPSLTFALLAPDTFSSLERTVRSVASQDVAAEIELLLLAPQPAAVIVPADLARSFHSVRLVAVTFDGGTGEARATAVREAGAPVVVFGEDHCFPDAGWAAALLRAHEGEWAAVGPVVTNANATTTVSWADLLMGYGPWLAPGESAERDHLPGHNTSYKRGPLLQFGDELGVMMEAETPLQWRLREMGFRLYQTADARTAHTNFEQWGTWLPVHFHTGRVFAATRALHWSVLHRVAFAVASPLVPFVRLRRHLAQAFAARWPLSRIVRVAPTLFVGLLFDAAGQCVGCLAGAGQSRDTLVDWEFRRNEPRLARAGR